MKARACTIEDLLAMFKKSVAFYSPKGSLLENCYIADLP